jgi:hypothetical protein
MHHVVQYYAFSRCQNTVFIERSSGRVWGPLCSRVMDPPAPTDTTPGAPIVILCLTDIYYVQGATGSAWGTVAQLRDPPLVRVFAPRPLEPRR